MDLDKLLWEGIIAIQAAGEKIIDVYQSNSFETQIKEDRSPLTKADLLSNEVICERLNTTNIPILSEELASVDYEVRKHWEYVWIVDPLDGTKEFIKRNGEFTVNIGLVQNQKPILGLVYIPVSKTLYFGHEKIGAYKAVLEEKFKHLNDLIENSTRLNNAYDNSSKANVVASRSHLSESTTAFIEQLKKSYEVSLISKGSALKLCLIAEGNAQVYPRLAPTMEWDTAAGHALINISGGRITLEDGHSPLNYNRKDLLNPSFIGMQKGFNIP